MSFSADDEGRHGWFRNTDRTSDSTPMRKASGDETAAARARMRDIHADLVRRLALPAAVSVVADGWGLSVGGASPESLTMRATHPDSDDAFIETTVELCREAVDLMKVIADAVESRAFMAQAAGAVLAERSVSDALTVTAAEVVHDGTAVPALAMHETETSWIVACDSSKLLGVRSSVCVSAVGCELPVPLRLSLDLNPRELVRASFAGGME